MSKDIDSLVLDNMRLVYYVINKSNRTGIEYEDLISIGTIGLINAAKTYTPGKSKFSTYATKCIKNEISMFLRKQPKCMVLSLDEPILSKEYGLVLGDIIPHPESDFIEKVELEESNINNLKQIIRIALNSLKGIDRLIMLYHISGEKQKWISKKLGISQASVSRSIRSSISRIRRKIKRENIGYDNEFFMVDIAKRQYQISFSTQNASDFCKVLAQFLLKTDKDYRIPEFEVSRNEEQTIITLFSDIKCLEFIADILYEVDNFKLSFKEV